MRKVFGAILITTATLAASSALPENAVWEHRAEMERLWNRSHARDVAPSDLLDRVFGQIEFRFVDPGPAEVGSSYGRNLRSDTGYGNGAWSGNFRGGLVHEPGGD